MATILTLVPRSSKPKTVVVAFDTLALEEFGKIGIGHFTTPSGVKAVIISEEEFDILLDTGETPILHRAEVEYLKLQIQQLESELCVAQAPRPMLIRIEPEPEEEPQWTLKERLQRFIKSWTS